jgi:hypothetical protein
VSDAQPSTLLRSVVPVRAVTSIFIESLRPLAGLDLLRRVRASIDVWLAGLAFPVDPYVVKLAAHELASNAILHGDGGVQILIAATETFGIVAVHDESHEMPATADAEFHGLWILSRVTNGHLTVVPVADNGKWVVAHLPAP